CRRRRGPSCPRSTRASWPSSSATSTPCVPARTRDDLTSSGTLSQSAGLAPAPQSRREMMIRKLSLAAAAALLAASPALADTQVAGKLHPGPGCPTRHLMSKVRGHFNDYAGTIVVDPAKPEAATVEFTIKAASIDTSNENRDKDLRSANFFDVEKFPEI